MLCRRLNWTFSGIKIWPIPTTLQLNRPEYPLPNLRDLLESARDLAKREATFGVCKPNQNPLAGALYGLKRLSTASKISECALLLVLRNFRKCSHAQILVKGVCRIIVVKDRLSPQMDCEYRC